MLIYMHTLCCTVTVCMSCPKHFLFLSAFVSYFYCYFLALFHSSSLFYLAFSFFFLNHAYTHPLSLHFFFLPPYLNILDKVAMETQSKCVGDKIDLKASLRITYLPDTRTCTQTQTHTRTFKLPSLILSLSGDSLNLLLWIPILGMNPCRRNLKEESTKGDCWLAFHSHSLITQSVFFLFVITVILRSYFCLIYYGFVLHHREVKCSHCKTVHNTLLYHDHFLF